MKLAWFTPWAPQWSGVVGRSEELVAALAARGHGIDVCVDERQVPVPGPLTNNPPRAGDVRVQSAHDFVWRFRRGQYDLAVYQLGNSRTHEFIWPYARRFSGLAVLHEARLHHARGRALLSRHQVEAYRTLFRSNEPDVNPDAAELSAAGFDGAYYYLWPMVRDLVLASRVVAVHARGAVETLRETCGDRPIEYVALGDGLDARPTEADRRAARAELHLESEAVVFGVFGALTPEKRLPAILRAFARLASRTPAARLILAGSSDPASPDWPAMARALGIAHAVRFLGPLDEELFDRAIAAADVTLHLRWPTALETSGPWLTALSAGRATITTNLAHQVHVPALDPRTWTPYATDADDDPVTVAVDILDEDHSLTLALRRLATDGRLRASLGQAARRYWEQEHTRARMIADYERVLSRAAATPAPSGRLPEDRIFDPLRQARALLEPFPEVSCALP